MPVWIFHTWTFYSGTNHAVQRQNTNGQNAGGQNTNQNCREHKTLAILWDRNDKMPILSRHSLYRTDSQVN